MMCFHTKLQTLVLLVYISNLVQSHVTPYPLDGLKDEFEIGVSSVDFTVSSDGVLVEKIESIPPRSRITLSATNIPQTVHFIIFQVHSYLRNVTISYDKNLEPGNHLQGTNIGLASVLETQDATEVYLINASPSNITALIVIQAYGNDDPIPGGCNMEFAVPTAPYLEVRYTPQIIRVDNQLASFPYTRYEKPPPCENQAERQTVEYEVYRLYLTERDFSSLSYFDGIKKMLTVKRIRENGKLAPPPVEGSQMKRIFSSYPGTASVYAVIAKAGSLNSHGESASAYVPALSYGCSVHYRTNSCDVLTTVFSKILYAFIFFIGIFICLVGHKFFKSEMFTFGFVCGSFISYILISVYGDMSYGGHVALSTTMGILFGAVWLAFWWFVGIPVLSVLLILLVLGYLLASVVFFAGMNTARFLQLDFNFWMTFGCALLIVPLLLISVTHKANILACAIVGGYAIIVPIDHYIGSSLKYIILNTVRRATVPEFKTAIIDPPFQEKDLWLTVTWTFLTIIGAGLQIYMHRNKPPFPPSPYQLYRQRRMRQDSLVPTENTRLIPDEPPPLYTNPILPSAPNNYGSTFFELPHPHVPDLLPVASPPEIHEEQNEEMVYEKKALVQNSN